MKNKKESWFKQLLSYAEGNKTKWNASIVFSIFSISSGIVPYFCLYKIVDMFIYGTITTSYIVKWCAIAIIFYFIKVVLFGISTGISHSVAYEVVAGLRLKLTNTFLKASLGEVQKYSIGEIKNTLVDKIENMEPPLAHVVPEGAGHIVLPLISIVALACLDYRLALASLITFPLAVVMMGLTFKISGKNFDLYTESNAYMSSVIVEYVEGIEVIKAFGKSGVAYEKFSDAILNYRKFVVQWLLSTLFCMKLAFTLFPATLLGVAPMAIYLVQGNIITISQAFLAILLSMSMVTSLTAIEVYSENLREIQRTCQSVQEFLDMKVLKEPQERVQIPNNHVQLKNVCFSYTGNKEDEVLHSIDLDLPEGSFTALVGPSGSGKSTVAKLLARFWDVQKGSIEIGGVNIQNMPLAQLCENISFVSQDNFLFNCSILENIRLGNPKASDEEVKKVAQMAQCEEFILKLPQGYDTLAGEAGKRLSGGEKQRIAIARMMLKNSPVVILDEATAFTDPENEAKIQKSLSVLAKGKTVLVIAHRLSTIKNADQIVVLEDGRIVQIGKQEELLESCPLYQKMWQAHIGVRTWAVGQGKELA